MERGGELYREPDPTGSFGDDGHPHAKMSLEVNEGPREKEGVEIRSKEDKFNLDIDVASDVPKGEGSLAERLERAKQYENMKRAEGAN